MKTVGIIAEYNPLHNGHIYHIEQSKRLTGADCVIAVMSGDFVQRGAPAIADKFLRAECALSCGADLVIELPTVYALSGAEIFAAGAVSLFNGLDKIDYISFGAESDNLQDLTGLAALLADETEEYQSILKSHLAKGIGFPAARSLAVTELTGNPAYASILESPNNILAVEYLKALIRTDSHITPIAIRRAGSGYHDLTADSRYPSASAVRNILCRDGIDAVSGLMPHRAYEVLNTAYSQGFPTDVRDFESLINYSILQNISRLEDFYDITPSLANKIRAAYAADRQPSFNSLINGIKSRELTHTRICRSIMHILLDIKQSDADGLISSGCLVYARILGFTDTGREFLSLIKSSCSVITVSNCADALSRDNDVSDKVRYLMGKDIFANDIYNNIVKTRCGVTLPDDFRRHPIIK